MEIAGLPLDRTQESAWRALTDPTAPNVYLWGPPGRGKSWLMDSYVSSHTSKRLLRRHFHEFFADVHRAIRTSGSLHAALAALLVGYDELCFDEFHVHDPADGQYVTALLNHVHDAAVRVIVTSNYPPANLLPNPLFHSMFEPTITLIGERFTVVECDGGVDYRTGTARRAPGVWLSPGDVEQLRQHGLDAPGPEERIVLSPAGHRIVADRAHSGEVWFSFRELCQTPTAAADYLPLAQAYRRWVITGVPALADVDADSAQRFAYVVDVLWDKRIELIVVASVSPEGLAPNPGAHDIDRMVSRLQQLPRAWSKC